MDVIYVKQIIDNNYQYSIYLIYQCDIMTNNSLWLTLNTPQKPRFNRYETHIFGTIAWVCSILGGWDQFGNIRCCRDIYIYMYTHTYNYPSDV